MIAVQAAVNDGDPADNWHCPHPNLANNRFGSACDSRRPTISAFPLAGEFMTFCKFALVQSINRPAEGKADISRVNGDVRS